MQLQRLQQKMRIPAPCSGKVWSRHLGAHTFLLCGHSHPPCLLCSSLLCTSLCPLMEATEREMSWGGGDEWIPTTLGPLRLYSPHWDTSVITGPRAEEATSSSPFDGLCCSQDLKTEGPHFFLLQVEGVVLARLLRDFENFTLSLPGEGWGLRDNDHDASMTLGACMRFLE